MIPLTTVNQIGNRHDKDCQNALPPFVGVQAIRPLHNRETSHPGADTPNLKPARKGKTESGYAKINAVLSGTGVPEFV
jgi:hypothetical protein